MLMPTVKRYMSRQPWTISPSAKMSEAHRVMREHRIRHLPVIDHGKLVGIVSERDLHLIETLPGGDPDAVTVDEAMIADVYAVSPDEEVDKVIERMADNKLGSALVVTNNGNVEGIFTTIDALQCFADVLRRALA
jgi:acetoin utilization protein AcuB